MKTPLILSVVNRPGWSLDHKSLALKRVLAGRYEVEVGYHDDLTATHFDRADVIVMHFWRQVRDLDHLREAITRNRHKLIVGTVEHIFLDDPARRDAMLETLREVPRAVFGNNRFLVQELMEEVGKPVFYVPNGVDTTLFTPGPLHDREVLRVGWTGSLLNLGPKHRRVKELIEPAVGSLEGVELVTAAREDRWRPHREMPAFYRSLDVYVCASRSEGTPNPCLEAGASGLPVVSPRVGNMPEFIADGVNGFLVEPTVDDIARPLAELRDHPGLRRRMREAMLETVPAWTWERQAENYVRMFDAVLARNPGSSRKRRGRPRRRLATILAIVSARNEERFIANCLDHLLRQGAQVHLIDNESEDRTVEIAERYLGRGLRAIESFPFDGEFRWRDILRRKEEIAAEAGTDWVLNTSPDEMVLPPAGVGSLAVALSKVGEEWNAIDLQEFTFVPTHEHPDHDHRDYVATMRWYYLYEPRRPHRVSLWRTAAGPADMAFSGGHGLKLPELAIAPERFPFKHYLALSDRHAREKYLRRKFPAAEVAAGLSGARARLTEESFALPAEERLKTFVSDAELDPSEPFKRHLLFEGRS